MARADSSLKLYQFGLELEFRIGDITKTESSCIVNSIDGKMRNFLKPGTAAHAVFLAGGEAIMLEALSRLSEFQTNGVVLTSSGNMTTCQYIIHINNEESSCAGHQMLLQTRIAAALRLANNNWIKDMAFPSLGQGGCGHGPLRMARMFCNALSSYHASQQSSSIHNLQVVKFCFLHSSLQETFCGGIMDNIVCGDAGGWDQNSPNVSLEDLLRNTSISGSSQLNSHGQALNVLRQRTRVRNTVGVSQTPFQSPTSTETHRGLVTQDPSVVSANSSTAPNLFGSSKGSGGSLNGASSASVDLKSKAIDAFQCKVCLGVIRPPVIMCTKCRQLIGCKGCVSQAAQHSPKCPYCRAQWNPSGNDFKEVAGLDEFLKVLDKEERADDQ